MEYPIFDRLSRRMSRSIHSYDLITPGDRVLIGLSGGKDSMALLDLLAHFRRRHNRNFHLVAVHVRMENVDYRVNPDELAVFAQSREVDFRLHTARFEPDRNENRSPCFLCSWTRRKALFDLAQQIGCEKIALGHHEDDLLRTALMNLTFSGSFSTMPVRLSMKRMPVTLIRPLCRLREDELRLLACERGYQPVEKRCPYEGTSRRDDINSVYSTMEKLNPEARFSMWHALERAGALVE